jgi:hypothetical protein
MEEMVPKEGQEVAMEDHVRLVVVMQAVLVV